MSITFKHTIIHVLDLALQTPILSTNQLILDDETEAFITKHLMKIMESSASSTARFNDTSSIKELLIEPVTSENFYMLSAHTAEKYYSYMNEYGNIPAGDLVITCFIMQDVPYLGILKLNYKEAFTHHVETNSEGITTKMIKHKGIFPSETKQVDEGVIINLEYNELMLLDQSKSRYLSLLFDCNAEISVKETLEIVGKVTESVIEAHYDNKVEALSELKANISDSLSKTQTIKVQDILAQTFGDDEEVYEECMYKIKELGVKDEEIEVTDAKLANKYSSQRLKTDTGIELKFPVPILKNPDYIEFINNPDGTFSIMLKNISQITNK